MNTKRISLAPSTRKTKSRIASKTRPSVRHSPKQTTAAKKLPTEEELVALNDRLIKKLTSMGSNSVDVPLVGVSEGNRREKLPTDAKLKGLFAELFFVNSRVVATLTHHYNTTPWESDPSANAIESFWEIREHSLAIARILTKNRNELATLFAAMYERIAVHEPNDMRLRAFSEFLISSFGEVLRFFARSSHLAPTPIKDTIEWNTFLEETSRALGKQKSDPWRYVLPQKEVAKLLYGSSSQKFVTRVRRAQRVPGRKRRTVGVTRTSS